jgi:medium-chain acyl-[acyl-carrier-protein] hydrolase
MQPIFECSLRVEAHDADSSGRLKVSSIFNHLQNAAAIHAERLGAGITEVLGQGLFWVLSWVKLEFSPLPRFGDEFSARTWPKCRYKLFSIRDFLFSGRDGEVFCRATTAWLLVDVKTKKAVSAQRLGERIPYQEKEHALRCYPERFDVEYDGRSVFARQVRYSDLDVNRHVNNARFTEFLMDCYPAKHHRSHRISSLTVAFVAEAKDGDELVMLLVDGSENGGGDFVEVRNARSGKPVVQALIAWMPAERVG